MVVFGGGSGVLEANVVSIPCNHLFLLSPFLLLIAPDVHGQLDKRDSRLSWYFTRRPFSLSCRVFPLTGITSDLPPSIRQFLSDVASSILGRIAALGTRTTALLH